MNNERSSAGNLNTMETDIRALIGDTDPETLSAPEVLGVMVEHFHPKLSLACSFQREESVLLDMLLAIAPDARVFALDTHVLFPETYDVWREVRSEALARLLVPARGVGSPRHAARNRSRCPRVRARYPCSLPRDLRRLARGRKALRDPGRGVPRPVARPPGGDPR